MRANLGFCESPDAAVATTVAFGAVSTRVIKNLDLDYDF
jgi:hypothetical protein